MRKLPALSVTVLALSGPPLTLTTVPDWSAAPEALTLPVTEPREAARVTAKNVSACPAESVTWNCCPSKPVRLKTSVCAP